MAADIKQSGTAIILEGLLKGYAANEEKAEERREEKRKFNEQMQMMMMGAEIQGRQQTQRENYLLKALGIEQTFETGERKDREGFLTGERKDREGFLAGERVGSQEFTKAVLTFQEANRRFAAEDAQRHELDTELKRLEAQKEMSAIDHARHKEIIELQTRLDAELADDAAHRQYRRAVLLRDLDFENNKELYQIQFSNEVKLRTTQYTEEATAAGLDRTNAKNIANIRASTDIRLGDQRKATQLAIAGMGDGELDPRTEWMFKMHQASSDTVAWAIGEMASDESSEKYKEKLIPILSTHQQITQNLADAMGVALPAVAPALIEKGRKKAWRRDVDAIGTQAILIEPSRVVETEQAEEFGPPESPEAISVKIKAVLDKAGVSPGEVDADNKIGIAKFHNITVAELEEILRKL